MSCLVEGSVEARRWPREALLVVLPLLVFAMLMLMFGATVNMSSFVRRWDDGRQGEVLCM